MNDYGDTLGVFGLSWQDKLVDLILRTTGIKVSAGEVNKMNEAYVKGLKAGLSGINLYDYIAGTSGVKDPTVAMIFAQNIEKYKTMESKNPLSFIGGGFDKILIAGGIALVIIYLLKFSGKPIPGLKM